MADMCFANVEVLSATNTKVLAINHTRVSRGKGYGLMTPIATFDIAVSDILNALDVQPVKRGSWITKAEDYYKAWQDSGRSWDDMPYFVTGLKFACSNCFEQFDVNAEGVEKWKGCPLCLARMDGDTE